MRIWLLGLLVWLPMEVEADRFDQWDRNKDGVLQKEELPAGLRANFERVDANRDGAITRAEEQAFLQSRPGRRSSEDGAAGRATDAFRVIKNLDYVGEGNPRQQLDLFLPREQAKSPRPLLVFIHGGAWRAGSKERGFGRLRPFLESGAFAGAAINYRLTGESAWPAQIHDCKAALRWLKAHASEYGFDAERVAVWGTSAGGHLAAMLGVTGDVPSLAGGLGAHLDLDARVACVVDYFGPSNLLTMDDHPSDIRHGVADSPEGKLVGGALKDHQATAREASPVTHVSKGDAPVLIEHGARDRLVPHMQSTELAEALRKVEVPVTFITMTDAEHGFESAELDRRVQAFLERHLLGREVVVPADPIPAGQ